MQENSMKEYDINANADKNQQGLLLVSDIIPDNLNILPLYSRPVFPGITLPITFNGQSHVEEIRFAIEKDSNFIGVSLVKNSDNPKHETFRLHEIGSILKIIKIIQITNDTAHLIVQAISRFKKVREIHHPDFTRWTVTPIQDVEEKMTDSLKAYTLSVMTNVKELIALNPLMKEQLKMVLSQISYENPGLMMDLIAQMLSAEASELQEILETYDLNRRAEKLLLLLRKEIELAQLQEKIQKQIDEKINKQQKEFFLREQLKAIKKELGLEKDDKTAEIEKIEKKIKSLTLPAETLQVVQEELDKLRILEPVSAEFHVTRTYLTTLTDLPWGFYSQDNLDIHKAREILDKEHFGLEDVKQRILEVISTIIKRGRVAGSILCLVGPPGVGKTSVGRSIANALGRKFYRFSVGGMRDEAEIKGHRRTYIGAMPGKIIQSLKRTGTSNPVIMLDEIDKIGISYQGDPASALLEVLDPEQNQSFLDHYLDVRYDLSNILFITTANQLDTIPSPLLDRMEIIKLPGYILEDKVEIAKKFLIPKQRKEHGLLTKDITITDGAIKRIAGQYAREAGVRNLENQIKKIMRQTTLLQAEKGNQKVQVNQNNLEEFLGKPIYKTEQLYTRQKPGIVLGLAWTPLGGTTLYVEASSVMSKSAGFQQTGQLGKVMEESSHIAYSYVRSYIDKHPHEKSVKTFFRENHIHLHVPAGATPKDGPSAGITMALALYSLALNKSVRRDIAMTGELSLTGKILPIGGVKEKTIAARRVGIRELILPSDNRPDYEDLNPKITEGIHKVHFVDYFEDLIPIAFPDSQKK
jgi:ATP-dependent Lon protease